LDEGAPEVDGANQHVTEIGLESVRRKHSGLDLQQFKPEAADS
jgi:hypothetical protein